MRYLQAQGLGQGECAGVNGMNDEICFASRCGRDAPVFNGPAVAHVEFAEDGIPVHSSSLHRTMPPLSVHMFCAQEHTAVSVLMGCEQQLQSPPQLSLVCLCEAPDMTHLKRKGTQKFCACTCMERVEHMPGTAHLGLASAAPQTHRGRHNSCPAPWQCVLLGTR